MALPLPRVVADVGPGGGIVTSMQGQNALTQSALNNKILQSQAEYAPYTNYADAASKIAYSQFVGPQALASILTNPNTRGMLSPEMYNKLANAVTSQISGQGNALSMLPVPKPHAQFGSGLLSMLINKLSGGGQQQPQQNALQPSANQAPISTPDVQNAVNNLPIGQGEQAPLVQPPAAPTQVSGGAGISPTYSRLAQQNVPSGAMGAINPPALVQAGENAIKTQTQEEAKAIADQWKSRQDDIKDQAAGAQEMERQLDRLDDARSRLGSYEKGPFFGKYLPAVTTAAIDSEVAASNLVAAKLRAWQSSRITNKDIDFGQMLKPGRYMTDQSYEAAKNYEKGLADRLQEYPTFALRAQQLGLSPAQADAVWIRYANEMPFYDTKSKQILGNNLGQWENYLTNESIQETFSPQYKRQMDAYRKNMAGGSEKSDEQIAKNFQESIPSAANKNRSAKEEIKASGQKLQNEKIKMRGVDPKDGKEKIWEVPQGKAQLFLDNGFKRVY